MTPSRSLLLRASKDDTKFLPGQKYKTLLFPFKAYEWRMTFERLIVDRLAYVGEVRALVADDENTRMRKGKILELLARLPPPVQAKLKNLLTSVRYRVWYQRPQGAIRHSIDNKTDKEAWKAEILKVMLVARMIIVRLGNSDSLSWEMQEIKRAGFFGKTIFLMPPFPFARSCRD